jgi:uncharacterized membrane protein YtjA (UPF0391 family)
MFLKPLKREERTMFRLYNIFLVNALLAALFTYSALPPVVTGITKGLLVLFLTFYIVTLLESLLVWVKG